jgi:hypothetical protein
MIGAVKIIPIIPNNEPNMIVEINNITGFILYLDP